MCVRFISSVRIGTYCFSKTIFYMFICLSLTRQDIMKGFFSAAVCYFVLLTKMRKLCFCLCLCYTKTFILMVWFRWRLKFNLSLAHFINIPISPYNVLFSHIQERSYYLLYCIFFIRNSTPHHIYFQFFYTFFIYIFRSVRLQNKFPYIVKRAVLCAFLLSVLCVGGSVCLGNVIQHDDQRQIALLCKNMSKIPFV